MHKIALMSRQLRLAVVMLALLVMGSLVAVAANESTNAPRERKPPLRVGEAYQTNPPPLASLNNILGQKPHRDDIDLFVRSFARIVFEPEDPTRFLRYPWIWKWAEPLRISLWRKVEPHHRELLAQVAGDLTDITGLPITTARFSGQLAIGLDSEPGESPFCVIFKRGVADDGSLFDVQMLASPLLEGDQLLKCFYEDISQALGVWHDLALTRESMYRSEAENGQWPKPTWHDVIMLRTLYDPRIKPGMHEDQAMPLVRVIIAELLEELNAVAE